MGGVTSACSFQLIPPPTRKCISSEERRGGETLNVTFYIKLQNITKAARHSFWYFQQSLELKQSPLMDASSRAGFSRIELVLAFARAAKRASERLAAKASPGCRVRLTSAVLPWCAALSATEVGCHVLLTVPRRGAPTPKRTVTLLTGRAARAVLNGCQQRAVVEIRLACLEPCERPCFGLSTLAA